MATKTKVDAKITGNVLKVTLTAGLVAKKDTQKRIVRALGLGKFGSTVEHADTPTIRGMIRKVIHLVKVEGNTEPIGKAKPKKVKPIMQAKPPKVKAEGKAKPPAKAKPKTKP